MHKGFADLSLTTWVRRLILQGKYYNQRLDAGQNGPTCRTPDPDDIPGARSRVPLL